MKNTPHFDNHPLLFSQTLGYPPLRGSVICICVPVEFRDHLFDQVEKVQFTEAFYKAKRYLEKTAERADIALKITPLILPPIRVEKPCFDKLELMYDALKQLLNRYDSVSISSLKRLLKLKLNNRNVQADVIDILFVSPLTNAISQAISHYSGYGPGEDNYCCIYKDPAYSSETIEHELLHLHGAVDLYPPQYIHTALAILGSSIMECNSKRIDPLTSHLIGWSDLDERAAEFLAKTSS